MSGARTARAPTGPRPGWSGSCWLAAAGAALLAVAVAGAEGPDERFREANAQARGGEHVAAIATYRELAAAGHESASLYWNWAQAAEARGVVGEALWALLRARELAPGDTAVGRDIERLRTAVNLDRAELSPVPLQALDHFNRRFHVGLLALVLLVLSLAAHGVARLAPALRWPVPVGWWGVVLGALLVLLVWLGAMARPTAVVTGRKVPLADAASPTALVLATMREGEVVPVLDASGPYLRIQDSSGARGWVLAEEVRRLDRPLPPVSR